jgi:hypothetical protein
MLLPDSDSDATYFRFNTAKAEASGEQSAVWKMKNKASAAQMPLAAILSRNGRERVFKPLLSLRKRVGARGMEKTFISIFT